MYFLCPLTMWLSEYLMAVGKYLKTDSSIQLLILHGICSQFGWIMILFYCKFCCKTFFIVHGNAVILIEVRVRRGRETPPQRDILNVYFLVWSWENGTSFYFWYFRLLHGRPLRFHLEYLNQLPVEEMRASCMMTYQAGWFLSSLSEKYPQQSKLSVSTKIGNFSVKFIPNCWC